MRPLVRGEGRPRYHPTGAAFYYSQLHCVKVSSHVEVTDLWRHLLKELHSLSDLLFLDILGQVVVFDPPRYAVSLGCEIYFRNTHLQPWLPISHACSWMTSAIRGTFVKEYATP